MQQRRFLASLGRREAGLALGLHSCVGTGQEPHRAAWGLDTPHSPLPTALAHTTRWPSQASELLTPEEHGSPLICHTLPGCLLGPGPAPGAGQRRRRQGPHPRTPAGSAQPREPFVHQGAPCLLARPSMPFAIRPPCTVSGPSHTRSSAICGPSASQPSLRQSCCRECPFPLWKLSYLSGPTQTESPLSKPDHRALLRAYQGAWCDESPSSPQGYELPPGRAWVTLEAPEPGTWPST